MKSKIERFLGGHLYPVLIVIISFVVWSFKYYIPDNIILTLSLSCLFLLTIPLCLVLIFYKNTIYTVPLMLALLFTLGAPNMGVDTFNLAIIGFINIALVIGGMIAHLVKYKVKLKLRSIGLSLILVSVSFIIPLIYTPFALLAIMLSLLGPLYLFVYLFYVNTIQGNQFNYLMRVFASLGLFLSFQMVAMWFVGFLSWEGTNLLRDFVSIFPQDLLNTPGWGNVNDLMIQLILFSSSVIYYLHKYPKNIMPWMYLGWIAFWIYVSNGRGSIIAITLFSLGCVVYAIFKHDKRQLLNLGVAALIAIILMLILSPLVQSAFESFFSSITFYDPNTMLSGRLTLWINHEYSAWNEFLRYPIFGRGWYTAPSILELDEVRLTMYHSTFFHILATGGIFGILVLGFHWYQIGGLLKKHIKIKTVVAFTFAFILTQLHGLIDNTQYMIHYSIVTYIAIAIIDSYNFSAENDILEVENNPIVEA